MSDGLKGTFNRPFKEAVAAFRLRLGNLVPTARWDDIWQDAHDRAFMVAGATKADLLADLAAAVDKAISQGTSLEEFRRDFRRIVEERGWHGWTGEGTKAGEAWRTRVIYRTNMATAYAAGRMAQLVEGGFALWVYRHGGSLEPRVIHLGWDGLVLPPDHPFWATHAPPNGWGCSCYVLGARTFAGAQRLGGKPGMELPPGWQKPDPRTGAPAGIDRGWAYAPGRGVAEDVRALAPKLDALPPEPSVALIQDWLRAGLFARWLEAPRGEFPLVLLPVAAAARIGVEARVAALPAETALRLVREAPGLTAADFAAAQAVVDGASEIFADGPERLIFVAPDPGQAGGLRFVEATRGAGRVLITGVRQLAGEAAARELARLRGER